MPVNKSECKYCPFHAQAMLRKLQSNPRPELGGRSIIERSLKQSVAKGQQQQQPAVHRGAPHVASTSAEQARKAVSALSRPGGEGKRTRGMDLVLLLGDEEGGSSAKRANTGAPPVITEAKARLLAMVQSGQTGPLAKPDPNRTCPAAQQPGREGMGAGSGWAREEHSKHRYAPAPPPARPPLAVTATNIPLPARVVHPAGGDACVQHRGQGRAVDKPGGLPGGVLPGPDALPCSLQIRGGMLVGLTHVPAEDDLELELEDDLELPAEEDLGLELEPELEMDVEVEPGPQVAWSNNNTAAVPAAPAAPAAPAVAAAAALPQQQRQQHSGGPAGPPPRPTPAPPARPQPTGSTATSAALSSAALHAPARQDGGVAVAHPHPPAPASRMPGRPAPPADKGRLKLLSSLGLNRKASPAEAAAVMASRSSTAGHGPGPGPRTVNGGKLAVAGRPGSAPSSSSLAMARPPLGKPTLNPAGPPRSAMASAFRGLLAEPGSEAGGGGECRSRYQALADEGEFDVLERMMSTLEEKDNIAAKLDSIKQLKVMAFKCGQCNLLTEHMRKECKGHPVTRLSTTKRFWECGHCNARTTTLGVVYPNKRCPRCNDPGKEFRAASMYAGPRTAGASGLLAHPAAPAGRENMLPRGREHGFSVQSAGQGRAG